MSPAQARQQVLLTPAAALLRQVVERSGADPAAARDVLDAAASRLGGFDLDGYREVLAVPARLPTGEALACAGTLLDLLDSGGVPPRLALAGLAQPALTQLDRRTTGAYYTDHRLARYLARRTATLAAPALTPASTVVDTAAGTGTLLVALAEQVAGSDRGAVRELVASGLCAVDLDPRCRAGTVAVLASLTADLDAITGMAARVRTAESLLAGQRLWHDLALAGSARSGAQFDLGAQFDAVIGNPPWERLRVTRHEFLLAQGARRHYGADYQDCDSAYQPGHQAGEADARPAAHRAHLDRVRRYVTGLASRYELLADREVDLWHAFLALGLSLVRPGGALGMLLPAGLIRSQGTAPLRQRLLTQADEVDITVFHNHDRFFAIDSRFKFLAVCARPATATTTTTSAITSAITSASAITSTTSPANTAGATLHLRHRTGGDPAGDGSDVADPAAVRIGFPDLVAARPDLSVPEVAEARQWQLFQHIARRGSAPRDPGSPWAMRITREIDMTRDRALFSRSGSPTSISPTGIPVVEGRMIQQYRSRAKTYVSGTGRAACWRPVAPGAAAQAVAAQFFVDPDRLPDPVRQRTTRPRVGFCDIVGQTNERTLQAALVEPGRVCGNKVPTIEFLVPEARAREMLFLAAVNSLVVDWFARRVVTTSLNYFILLGLPLPVVDPAGAAGPRLVALAEQVVAAETAVSSTAQRVTEARGEIDELVCAAYGIDLADLAVILADFPLLDRGQPALPGESRSTVTADLLAARCGDERAAQRYAAASALGAVAYVPCEFAHLNGTRERAGQSGQSGQHG